VKEVRPPNEAVLKEALVESRSPSFRNFIESARQAATTDAIILLTGETGVGKNIFARQIHEWSSRRERPFVTIRCAVVSETSPEFESFSQTKGSIQHPARKKTSRIDAANGGTIFLDEVADLALNLQARVLYFIEDCLFKRVGEDAKLDIRIIAATSHSLFNKVSAGQFRSDLFYRLKVVSLHIPPLREHMEDLVPFAEKFLTEAATRHGRSAATLSAEAKKALSIYGWPGNVRELFNVVERVVVLSREQAINKNDLPREILSPLGFESDFPQWRATLEQIEAAHIRRVLAHAASQEDAAAILGIGLATLWRKRKRYQIE
jgi:NtrC-family two-component system response regulator AlgB